MQEQFTQAYTEHADALFRYAWFKTNDRELSKDLVQETLLSSWRYVQSDNAIVSFKSLFYKILHNRIIDYYRKKKSTSLDMLLEKGIDFGNDPRENLIDELDGKRAMKYIEALPKEYRDAVFMRYVDDLSISEIATITGTSNNTTTVRIHRGLEKLKKLIG